MIFHRKNKYWGKIYKINENTNYIFLIAKKYKKNPDNHYRDFYPVQKVIPKPLLPLHSILPLRRGTLARL